MRRFSIGIILLFCFLLSSASAQIGPSISGHTIQEESIDLAKQNKLSFLGSGVTCVNDSVNQRTACTFDSQSVAGGAVDSVTLPCVPFTLYNLTTQPNSSALWRCDEDGLSISEVGYQEPALPTNEVVYSIDGTIRGGSSGVRLDADNIISRKDKSCSVSVSQTLDASCVIWRVTVGTGGAGNVRLTLPSVSTSIGGFYILIIVDEGSNSLELAASGNETMGGSVAIRSVTGYRSGFLISLVCSVPPCPMNWDVTTRQVGLNMPSAVNAMPTVEGRMEWDSTKKRGMTGNGVTGFPTAVGLNCTSTGGDANNSASGSGSFFDHSLTCIIPANTFHTNSQARICSAVTVVTGAAAPVLSYRLKSGAASLIETTTFNPGNNVTANTLVACFTIIFTEDPNNTAATITFMEGLPNSIVQPIDQDTDSQITFTFATKWATAGTGTNTVTQRAIYGTLSK